MNCEDNVYIDDNVLSFISKFYLVILLYTQSSRFDILLRLEHVKKV